MGLGGRRVARFGGEVVPWGPSSSDVVRVPFFSGLFVPLLVCSLLFRI